MPTGTPKNGINKGWFKKGCKGAWLDGRPAIKGEKNPHWKGDNAGYVAIHAWVARWKGRPKICEVCGNPSNNVQWANIDHRYRRVLEDYIAMCYRCHAEYNKKHNFRKHKY